MYVKYNVSRLLPAAEQFIQQNDRMLYAPFFAAAEEFISKHEILIGGRVGIDLLVGRELSKDSFFWELYTDDTFNTAKSLANVLFNVRSAHVQSKTVALRTDIRHREFTIFIEARMFFKVYAMDKYRGIKLKQLMGPAARTGYFTRERVLCISEEMQLIEIYRTLYTPAKIDMWETELRNENILYNMIKDYIGEKVVKVGGGAGAAAADEVGLKTVGKQLQDTILRKLIPPGNVLIGDHALAALGLDVAPSRIQFISDTDIEQLRVAVERIVRGMKLSRVTLDSVVATYIKYPLNIPNDFQIIKYTIYISNGKDQLPVADVFNSAQFEMIPFITCNYTRAEKPVRVAAPWVLLRFMFIDIWVLKLILGIGKDNPDYIKDRMRTVLKHTDMVRTEFVRPDRVQELFQLNNYAGKYISEMVAKKRLIKEIGERLPIYYPAMHSRESAAESDDKKIESSGVDMESTSPDMQTRGGHGDHGIPSQPIDLTFDPMAKRRILQRIVGSALMLTCNDDMLCAMREYAKQLPPAADTKWGTGKSLRAFFYKNKPFLRHIPHTVDTLLDVGCGDGLDTAAIASSSRVHVRRIICADIEDNRKPEFASSEFVKVELAAPIALADDTADLVLVFHVIHHIQEDIEFRLRDIVRCTAPGGLIFIKDHDVTTPEQASNVDFEHLVYMLTEPAGRGVPVEQLMREFPRYEPMFYRSAEEINKIMLAAGCERVDHFEITNRTYIYGAVYRKIGKK